MAAVENDSNFVWERAFVYNMARLRKMRGMSQNELANRLTAKGLPFYQATVQRVENGERSVRLDEACVIAELFEVSLDAMMTNFEGPMETASYSVDRVRRFAGSLVDAGQEDFGEFLNEFEILSITFDEMLTASGHKATSELSWLAAWLIKCGWVIESWIDVERYANGLTVKSGDWHEAHVTMVEAWTELQWLQDESVEMWQVLPEKERPWFLADLDPIELQRWIIGRSSGEHSEAP
ncbi:helix-turn-helix domain-containing protein [Leucobacter tenebrionis]|uniref:helix-turn-helix domain-containing protein n=1 Tax=Leucobacter tenebrionis TaxID=2873270 RepID=UPI001CA762F9|nr:helix-turn-helix transcriptional regulator [Leucobacter tenebrionis]QZY52710.1 helix-turn-helix domain-containing protein [Leucobacter tenebrionis]